MNLPVSKLTKNQTKTFTKLGITDPNLRHHGKVDIIVDVRYDDHCGNGHNSFAITGTVYNADRRSDRACIMGGCIHDVIEKHFPELSHLIKWHLCNSDGPMHYIANTMYHACDTDCDGLKSGEYGAYKLHVVSNAISKCGEVLLYKTGQIYTNKQNNPNLTKSNNAELEKMETFTDSLNVSFSTVKINCPYSISKGKGSDLAAARRCAIWPDATIEQLCDKELLLARLPALIAEFKATVKSIGFEF